MKMRYSTSGREQVDIQATLEKDYMLPCGAGSVVLHVEGVESGPEGCHIIIQVGGISKSNNYDRAARLRLYFTKPETDEDPPKCYVRIAHVKDTQIPSDINRYLDCKEPISNLLEEAKNEA